MERLTLTEDQQAEIDAKKVELGVEPDTVVFEGTNLMPDDHVEIDDGAWYAVIVGPSTGCIMAFVPDWPAMFPVDFAKFISDRIGPNGETMPIWLPEEPPEEPEDPPHVEHYNNGGEGGAA